MIGTGNVATILSRMLFYRGHEVIQVFGRNPDHAQELAQKVNASAISNAAFIDHSADIFIVALSDNALYELENWLQIDRKLVVHTAGSVPMSVLGKCSKNYGVLYPLQSLRKEMKEIPPVPFLIEGNTADDLCVIEELANDLSGMVVKMSSEDRMHLHIGAVFVSNFTNFLYARTEELFKEQGLDFKLLLPLMKESVNRLEFYSPAEMQTGPAVRNDQSTIQKHLELLKDHPDLATLYNRLSEDIYHWKR
jgi:predicted short-subunit dehydrogenase-like oxidoreductase (DUF2520 family)